MEYLTGSLNTGAVGAVPVDLGANPDTNATAKNFAWAGSTSGTGYTTIGGIYDLANFRTQISNYVTIMSNGLLPAPQTALMTLWSGGNDAIYWIQAGTYTVEGMQATAKVSSRTQLLTTPNSPFFGIQPTRPRRCIRSSATKPTCSWCPSPERPSW